MKKIYAVFSISITLFSNHLKYSPSRLWDDMDNVFVIKGFILALILIFTDFV